MRRFERFVGVALIGSALLGALMCFLLVRKEDRFYRGRVFGRRSRWIMANVATTPGVSRHPPPPDA